MNYLKHYCKLIRKAENRTPPEGYTEKHHIFPKSIFGKNNRIVVLTSREHYIAHALLEKICIKRYGFENWRSIKMNKAHILMSGDKYGKGRYCNSRLYESAIIRSKNFYRGKNHFNYGKKRPDASIRLKSEESHLKTKNVVEKRNASLKNLGDNHPSKRESHREMMRKMWISNHPMKNPSTLQKISGENHYLFGVTGDRHPLYGRLRTDEEKEKISQAKCKNTYKATNPDGKIFYTKNLTKFCKEHNLQPSAMSNVVNKKAKHHKKWVVEKI
jgi:hypothetical protein